MKTKGDERFPRKLGGFYQPPFAQKKVGYAGGSDVYIVDANGVVVTYQDMELILNKVAAIEVVKRVREGRMG